MAKIKLTYKENKAYYNGVLKGYEDELKAIIEDTAQNIETEAVSKAPVDTGILRSSINAQVKDLDAVIGTPVKYAPFMEFGTGGLVDVPEGLESYANKYKGKGVKQVNLPPRPFLFNTWRDNGIKMLERIKKLIDGDK